MNSKVVLSWRRLLSLGLCLLPQPHSSQSSFRTLPVNSILSKDSLLGFLPEQVLCLHGFFICSVALSTQLPLLNACSTCIDSLSAWVLYLHCCSLYMTAFTVRVLYLHSQPICMGSLSAWILDLLCYSTYLFKQAGNCISFLDISYDIYLIYQKF